MSKCCAKLCPVCKVLAAVGAINWGLIGALKFNLVTTLLGDGSMPTRVVYILIGLAGVFVLVGMLKGCGGTSKCCTPPPQGGNM